MTEVIDAWGIISGSIAVGAIAVAFRAEILVRVRVLEEKVQTLFELFNRMFILPTHCAGRTSRICSAIH